MSTEEIKEYIGTQLKALTSIASPTGFTKNATDYLMKQLEAMGYAPQLSNKGNVSVEIGGEGSPLVLAAHVDTLGAMVRSIKDNGRLRPTTIGGHQWSTADGENCMVVAGNHCIFNMLVEIIYQQVCYRSNASLREIGVRFLQLCLADDGYFPFIGYLQCEAHAGDTGTDH